MKYYIIAGEASGDLHGSNLIKGLKAEDARAEIRFWGGDLMAAAGGTLVHHYKEGAVMGITDVLAKAGKLIENLNFCKEDISVWSPDVVILIDYPGFNMRIAKFCHRLGIKVFYYIAPKTWASRENRNRKLRQWVDKMFIVFPFEVPYFTEKGVPFIYKGNPLIDAIDGHDFQRPVEGRYIALLAGSRKAEISRMMPVCMEVADRLGCQVVIAGAPARSEDDYSQFIGGRTNVRLLFGRTYDILKYADAAIINSGTASLEAALIGTPQVVCWSTSGASFWIMKHILRIDKRIKFISLGNLCLDKFAFKELIQDKFTVESVLSEIRRLTEDEPYRNGMLADYREIRESLGGAGASRAVAKAMMEEIKKA